VLLVAYARNLFRSRVGRAFVAIRDRDLAAEIMGIDLFRYKLMAFAVSSFYAGVCGALWVSFMRIVTPEHSLSPFDSISGYDHCRGTGKRSGVYFRGDFHDADPGIAQRALQCAQPDAARAAENCLSP